MTAPPTFLSKAAAPARRPARPLADALRALAAALARQAAADDHAADLVPTSASADAAQQNPVPLTASQESST